MVMGFDVRIRGWVGRPVDGSAVGGLAAAMGVCGGCSCLGCVFCFCFYFSVVVVLVFCCNGSSVRRWWGGMWGVDG